MYKYEFSVLKAWQKKRVFIVFEGSMTDTEAKIYGNQPVLCTREHSIGLSMIVHF